MSPKKKKKITSSIALEDKILTDENLWKSLLDILIFETIDCATFLAALFHQLPPTIPRAPSRHLAINLLLLQ